VSSDTPPMHILFICRGNICRSPMAMVLLRHRMNATADGLHVVTSSAGYFDFTPFRREAHPFARRAIEEVCGTDLLAGHVARCWRLDTVRDADLVVVAEAWMRDDFPRQRVITMRELGGEVGDVKDPYGGDYERYVACACELDRLIKAGMSRLYGLCDTR